MSPRLSKLFLMAGLALLPACESELLTAPRSGSPDPAVLALAFRIDINVETGEVRVVNPIGSVAEGRPGLAFSLMGAEVVGLTVSNVVRSPVGQFVPNKRTIKFDLALTNRLSVTDLVTPTFPIPPAGVQGVIAFPYTVGASGVAGGKATPDTTWNGTGLLPSGRPHNFFNDLATCPAGVTSDCYRWEAFVSPLAPGVTTAAQRVGFTVDPGVTSVQVYVVVAADLLDHPPVPLPGKGAVLGVVSSPVLGLLAGVTVTAAPGGATGVTDGLGKYLLTGLDAGTATLTLSGLPAGCTDPGPQSVAVVAGGLATGDFTVACGPPVGSVTGTVTSLELGPLPGVGVGIFDLNFQFSFALTAANGSYAFQDVLSGAAHVFIASGLPQGCDPEARDVTVPIAGALVVDITLDCSQVPGTVTGTVTSPQLGPVAGHDVEYVVVATNVVVATPTDANGGFSFTNVPPGDIIVSLANRPAGCADPGSVVLTMLPAATMVVDFSVDCSPATGTISGMVTVPPHGGYPGVGVSAVAGTQNCATITDAAGSYSMACPSGSWIVTVFTPDPCDNPGSQTVTVPQGSAVIADFTVTGCPPLAGSLSGTVTSPQLGPLALVKVVVLDSRGSSIRYPTVAGGVYDIITVSAGPATVGLESLPPGCTADPPIPVFVPIGGAVTLDFSVDCSGPVGSVTGTVTSPELGPLSAEVFVGDRGGTLLFGFTDGNGQYTFGRVTPGATNIQITGVPSGCAFPPGQLVTVVASANLVVDFTVDCSGAPPGPLTGTVDSPTLGRLDQVTVELFDSHGGVIGSVLTDRFGGYSFGDLTPGTYLIALTRLPQGCADPGQQTAVVLPTVGAVALFSVSCD